MFVAYILVLPWYQWQYIIAIDFGPYHQCQTEHLALGWYIVGIF